MISVSIKVPLEVLDEKYTKKILWEKMSIQLMNNLGIGNNYCLKFSERYEQDDSSPYVKKILSCNILETTNQSIVMPTKFETIEMQLPNKKINRSTRLWQFLTGN